MTVPEGDKGCGRICGRWLGVGGLRDRDGGGAKEEFSARMEGWHSELLGGLKGSSVWVRCRLGTRNTWNYPRRVHLGVLQRSICFIVTGENFERNVQSFCIYSIDHLE